VTPIQAMIGIRGGRSSRPPCAQPVRSRKGRLPAPISAACTAKSPSGAQGPFVVAFTDLDHGRGGSPGPGRGYKVGPVALPVFRSNWCMVWARVLSRHPAASAASSPRRCGDPPAGHGRGAGTTRRGRRVASAAPGPGAGPLLLR
jgi:hypothetical protein